MPRWELTAWAKLGNGTVEHPLIRHAIDTAAVAECLYPIVLGPRVRAEIEEGLSPLGDPQAWVAVLCGLHDLGKLTPSFQAVRNDRALDLLGPEAGRELRANEPDAFSEGEKVERWDTRHELFTAVHVDQWLRDRGAGLTLRDGIVLMLGGHHGSYPGADEIRKAALRVRQLGEDAWRQARDRLIASLLALWGLDADGADWRRARLSTTAVVGLSGLTILSDWTASDKKKFEYHPYPGDDLDRYRENMRDHARDLLRRVNWEPWRPPTDVSYEALFPDDEGARPLQQRVMELVQGRKNPGILVIEAPTGEGKTKAGLLGATALARELGRGGMYVGTPNRATAGPVHGTVNEMLEATGSGLRALLMHSSADKDLERQVEEGEVPEVIMPAGVDEFKPQEKQGDLSLLDMAKETFKVRNGLMFPIGVGTVDQALKAALRSKYVSMRLASLSNKVLVIDEVHSYEPYMVPLLDRLLWWCGKLGVPVVLMSATLSVPRREALIDAWCTGARGEPTGPPVTEDIGPGSWRLTWAEADHREPPVPLVLSEDNPGRSVRVERIDDDPEDIAEEVVHSLREKGCAAVIRNSPAEATKVRDSIRRLLDKKGLTPELFFLTGPEFKDDEKRRLEVEANLEKACGPYSVEPRYAVAVGTQILEHGLDCDFDLMISDPCPVDLLVQRAGRLHRHRKKNRPAPVSEPRLVVVKKQKDYVFPTSTATIYGKDLLMGTNEELRRSDVLQLPNDIPSLVHAVYVAEDRISDPGLRKKWKYERERRANRESMGTFDGRANGIPMLAPSGSVRPLTEHPVSSSKTRRSTNRRPEESRQE